MTIRLILADDHPIVLDGLAKVFSAESDFEVLACATNGDEALRWVRQYRPDILVLDLRMPGKDGLAVLREMKRDKLATQAVVLTALAGDEVFEAIRLGVRGIVLKDMAPRFFVQCVRKVHAGGKWLEHGVTERAVDNLLAREAKARATTATLTRRELEIARMVADGWHSKAVARKLAISEGTAKVHLHHVYEKLHLDGRVALARYMQRNGLV